MMMPESTYLIAKSVWIDFSRRKDFYVVASFLLVFAAGALTARLVGVANDSASRLLLSCGMGLASSLSAILLAVFAARVVPEEMEARTLYPLLAKPISRSGMLWGKWWGIWTMGLMSLVVFGVFAWLPVPKTAQMHWALLAQAVVLQAIAMGGLCWMAIWMSIRLPSMLSALASLMIFFIASPVIDFAGNMIGAPSPGASQAAVHVLGIVPDWGAMRFFQAYVEGARALGADEFLALSAYGLAFAALFASLSVNSFERKPL